MTFCSLAWCSGWKLTRAWTVLTKVFVYCGIGMVATGVVPVMFEVLGWGVKMA